MKIACPLARRDLPLSEAEFSRTTPDLTIRLGSRELIDRSLGYAASGGQGSGQGSKQGGSPIDDRGPDPLRVIYGDPLLLFGSSSPGDPLARDIYGLGGRPALRDPCGASAAGRPLEPACWDQGTVIFAGTTFRRKKCAAICSLGRQ